MAIEAAIDIGTNTMLQLIGEVAPADRAGGLRKIVRTVDDQIRFVRLGQAVHQNRFFLPEAMERSLAAFREFRGICDEHGATKIHAVATSASRDSKNSAEFYARVKRETGIEVKIVHGEIEARLSFVGGMLPFQDAAKTALLDIGGGSTEFVVGDAGGENVRGQSIDMGCVRATEMFLKGDPYEISSVEAMEKHLKSIWKEIKPELASELREKDWTGIAGTPTTLAALDLKLGDFISEKVDGYRMDRCQVADWFETLATQTQKQRASHPLMGTGRADIMVAGVGILLSAMEFFDKADVLVSSRGLRHGVLLSPPV